MRTLSRPAGALFFRVWLEAAAFCFEFVLRVMFVFFSVKTEPNEFFFNLNNIYAIKLLDIVPGNLVVVELFGSEARVRDKFIEIRKSSRHKQCCSCNCRHSTYSTPSLCHDLYSPHLQQI